MSWIFGCLDKQASSLCAVIVCIHMLTGQDEMEDINITCTADELDENDSIALYFCSPKITANGKRIYGITFKRHSKRTRYI